MRSPGAPRSPSLPTPLLASERCAVRLVTRSATIARAFPRVGLADVTLTVLPATGKAAATSSTDPIKDVRTTSSDSASRPAATTKGEEPDPGPTAVSSAVPAQTSGPALKSASGGDRSSQSAGGSAAPVSEIAQRAQEGLIPFLIASALGGLFALLMPCVWPMIPITVNFFVKQGQNSAGGKGKGKTTGLAVTYCLAIIGLFTAVGVFFSFFSRPLSCKTWPITPG